MTGDDEQRLQDFQRALGASYVWTTSEDGTTRREPLTADHIAEARRIQQLDEDYRSLRAEWRPFRCVPLILPEGQPRRRRRRWLL